MLIIATDSMKGAPAAAVYLMHYGVLELVTGSGAPAWRSLRCPTEPAPGTMLMMLLTRTAVDIAACVMHGGPDSAFETLCVLFGCTEGACTAVGGDTPEIAFARRVARSVRGGTRISLIADALKMLSRHGVPGPQRSETAEAGALAARASIGELLDAAAAAQGAAVAAVVAPAAAAAVAGCSFRLIYELSGDWQLEESFVVKCERLLAVKEAALSAATAGGATPLRDLALAARADLLAVLQSRLPEMSVPETPARLALRSTGYPGGCLYHGRFPLGRDGLPAGDKNGNTGSSNNGRMTAQFGKDGKWTVTAVAPKGCVCVTRGSSSSTAWSR